MSIQLRDELRKKYGSKPTIIHGSSQPAVEERERAFVTHAASGRTVITAPVRETAMANEGFMYLRGRFVEADTANLNGAYWSTDDLQMGGATIAGGPLNWLHDETKIIGSLLQGELIHSARESADIGNHIVADAAVWKYLFPDEARTIERAATEGKLYYSMECVSREVACLDTPGRPGCGEHFSYGDYDAGKTCAHLRERSSVRRFVDPIFLGGAVIVPPVMPGWDKADATIRQAAGLTMSATTTDNSLSILPERQALDLATAVLQWANR